MRRSSYGFLALGRWNGVWEENKLDRVGGVSQRRGASVFERSLQLGADVLCTGGFAWLHFTDKLSVR